MAWEQYRRAAASSNRSVLGFWFAGVICPVQHLSREPPRSTVLGSEENGTGSKDANVHVGAAPGIDTKTKDPGTVADVEMTESPIQTDNAETAKDETGQAVAVAEEPSRKRSSESRDQEP